MGRTSRFILMSSMILTLLLLPSLPGCGCGEDSGDPTSLRGGCRICVAFRVLERDLPIRGVFLTGPDPSTESLGPPTIDLKLCIDSEDAGLGGVSVAPPCVEDLELGDVAEWEIILGEENPSGIACFTVCECIGDDPKYSFCVEWFGDCDLYRIFDPLEMTASSGTGQPMPIGLRVTDCDEMPDLCCFCIDFQCLEGFQQPEGPVGVPLAGDGAIESTNGLAKEVCVVTPQFDPSLADATTGGVPIVKPRCQFVDPYGGVVQFEICVLDTYAPGSTLFLDFFEPPESLDVVVPVIGSALIVFGSAGSCEVILEGTDFVAPAQITLNPNCDPPQQVCCFPVSICAQPATDLAAAEADITAKVLPATTHPGPIQIYPPLVKVPDIGGSATFWICVPESDPGTGDIVVGFCSSADFFGVGGSGPYSIGTATLTYGGSCTPSFSAPQPGPNQSLVVPGATNACGSD